MHLFLFQVNSVAWNETGTKLISGSDDCYLNIYDTATQLVGWLVSFPSIPLHGVCVCSSEYIPLSIYCDLCLSKGLYASEMRL